MSESDEMDHLVMGRRKAAFVEAGCHPEEAAELAYHMMIRDRENRGSGVLDDRRVCFECKHLEKQKYCNAYKDHQDRPVPQLRFTLQRCPKFKLKGKK